MDSDNASTTQDKPAAQVKRKQKQKEQLQRYMAAWFRQYYQQATIAVCVVLFLAGFMVAIRPKFVQARAVTKSQFEELINDQRKLSAKLEYLVAINAERDATAVRDIERITAALPSGPDTPELITSIEAIARDSGVVVESMELAVIDPGSFTGEDVDENITNLPEKVQVVEMNLAITTGPYDELKTFLAALERSLRLIDVAGITYSPRGKSYILVTRSYFLPE